MWGGGGSRRPCTGEKKPLYLPPRHRVDEENESAGQSERDKEKENSKAGPGANNTEKNVRPTGCAEIKTDICM